MDIVYIKGLEVDAVIGVYEWERLIRQTLRVDVHMQTDIAKTAALDDLSLTLDYKRISDCIIEFIQSTEFYLVETLAEELAALILADFNVGWLRLKLAKPNAVIDAQEVGVIIERGVKAS